MKLIPIKANMTEVQIGDKIILFSYQTPVAYIHDAEDARHFYQTTKKWSVTTSRHISQWLPDDGLDIEDVEQSVLDTLVK